MSATTPCAEETTHERTVYPERSAEFWLDDELFDNLADIINGNFVLEVEASLELRS